jgi:NADH dehydrogenase
MGKPRIVIVGGGFGGIQLARNLKKPDFEVILIDKNNYHTFQPLLYQVATAGLEPDSIAYPLREISRRYSHFNFRMAEVREVVPFENKIRTSIGEFNYDYLVLAAGSTTNYFGLKDFQKFAYPMKSIPEASQLRNLILENMEKALLARNIDQRKSLMNIVIVGGGPTGVEMAGALGELKNKILPRDYPELDFTKMHIHVVDMADRLLPAMSSQSSQSADLFLKRFEVDLSLSTKVISYDGQGLVLSNGKKILTCTVIWAAGVSAVSIPGVKAEDVADAGRLKVNIYNQLEGYENIFVIGDMACMITQETPKGHPMLAPVAIQQAKNLAQNFYKIVMKKALWPFSYKNPGVMATIGRNHAVVEVRSVKLQGRLAWIIWLFVHLMALVGFRNRLIVFINWTWNYFTYDRGLRLIIKPEKRAAPSV